MNGSEDLFWDCRKLVRGVRAFSLLYKKTPIDKTNAEELMVDRWYKEKPVFSQKNIFVGKYDLLIVLPVYNVEKYLESCLNSLFQQNTNFTYCVIAVDDGSTDNSRIILQQYKAKENFEIITQENKGLSGARNRALQCITGKYTMFVDSDDILPPNAIEALMSVAMRNDADVVAGGYTEFSEKGVLRECVLTEREEQVTADRIPGFACMKVFKSELLKNFCFPEGYLFEDTVIHRLVLPECKKIYVIPDIVYAYRMHETSLTHTSNEKSLDTYWITKYCLEEAKKRCFCFGEAEYMQLLQQCWVNYIRTRYMPERIQESLFVLTAAMLEEYWPRVKIRGSMKYKLLHSALKKRSYVGYRYILRRWEYM